MNHGNRDEQRYKLKRKAQFRSVVSIDCLQLTHNYTVTDTWVKDGGKWFRLYAYARMFSTKGCHSAMFEPMRNVLNCQCLAIWSDWTVHSFKVPVHKNVSAVSTPVVQWGWKECLQGMHCVMGRISLFWCCTTSQMRHVMLLRKWDETLLLSTDKCKSEILILVHKNYCLFALIKIQHWQMTSLRCGKRSILFFLLYLSFATCWQDHLANQIQRNQKKLLWSGFFL